MNFSSVNRLIDAQSAECSVILKRMDTNEVLFSHNLDRQMRSASIIKLLIHMTLLEEFESGTLTPDAAIAIPRSSHVPFSLVSDLSQTSWRLDDLAVLMIILSDNTATNALIELLGYEAINKTCLEYGLTQTHLRRKMYDFEASRSGCRNETSMADMICLLEVAYRSMRLGEPKGRSFIETLGKQKNKTMLGRFLPESVEIAHKTGLNDGIQHDIGFIQIKGETYLIGVFMDGEANEVKGFECIGQIALEFFKEVSK